MMGNRVFGVERLESAVRSRSGFTIWEMVIALGILAVGMVSIYTLLPLGVRSANLAVDDTFAASAARLALAEISRMGRERLKPYDGSGRSPDWGEFAEIQAEGLEGAGGTLADGTYGGVLPETPDFCWKATVSPAETRGLHNVVVTTWCDYDRSGAATGPTGSERVVHEFVTQVADLRGAGPEEAEEGVSGQVPPEDGADGLPEEAAE